MPKRRKDVILFDAPPVISAWGSAGGKKEGEGPLASAFDYLTQDAAFADENCANWEQAESMLQQKAAGICLRKAGIAAKDVDLTFAGDLQAQCTASNYTLRTLATPFAGLYGACSTMTEALCLGAAFAAAGLGRQILAMTSSHFCAAERQFRTPLEYGAKRTPTAQWTATAAGACLLRGPGQGGVQILSATFGRVQDYGVTDINNMGAAMMPAAASTLLRYFDATGAAPADFDAIWARWAAICYASRWRKRACPCPTTTIAAVCCTMWTARTCRRAAAGPGAVPPCCVPGCCPGCLTGGSNGCCSYPPAH